MKSNLKYRAQIITCFLLLIAALCLQAQAQGTAFTYQGMLQDGGASANGVYDLQFRLFDAATSGSVVAGPLTNSATTVSNGVFVTTVDFGSSPYTGGDLWLELAVSTNAANAFSVLTPRQHLTPAPYAILAGTAAHTAANSVNAGSILPNTIGPGKISNGTVVRSLNGLTDLLTLNAGTNVTITPNGSALTFSAVGGGGSGIWAVSNNNAYFNSGNVGVGTASPQEKLTLAGVTSYNTGLKVTGSSPGGTGIALENTDAGGHKYDLISGGALDGIGAGAFGLYDETIAGYRLAIATNGNVGIGIVSPQATLDIASPQHALALTAYGPDVTFKDTGHANARGSIQGVGGDLNFFTESYLSGANPFSFLKVANNGNVGVGNPQPQMTLDIVSAQHAIGMTAYGPDVTFYDTGHGYARDVIQSVNGDLNFFTESYLSGANPSSFLKVANNGNVGIGTPAPTAKLQVNDTSGVAVYGVSSASTGGAGVFGESSAPGGAGVHGYSTGAYGHAIYASGDAGQDRDKGGFVKAMAKINADGSVAQSFSALGGQITASGGNGGYVVVFPFQINDRFISVTPFYNDTHGPIVANIVSFPDPNSVFLDMWPVRDSGFIISVPNVFFIFVY